MLQEGESPLRASAEAGGYGAGGYYNPYGPGPSGLYGGPPGPYPVPYYGPPLW